MQYSINHCSIDNHLTRQFDYEIVIFRHVLEHNLDFRMPRHERTLSNYKNRTLNPTSQECRVSYGQRIYDVKLADPYTLIVHVYKNPYMQ